MNSLGEWGSEEPEKVKVVEVERAMCEEEFKDKALKLKNVVPISERRCQLVVESE